MTTVGRARRSRDGGRDLQRHPARGGEHLHRPVQLQRLERRAAGQQLHAGAQRRGPAGPVRADQRVRRQRAWTAAGSCGTSCGSTASTARSGASGRCPACSSNKNAGNPNAWTVDFDRSQQAFNNSLERQATVRLTWQATPRNKFNFHWAEQYNDANYGPGGGTATTTPEASSRVAVHPVASTPCHLAVADLGPACWPRPAGACIRPGTASATRNDGTHNPAMIQRLEQAGEIPGLTSPGCLADARAPGKAGSRIR